MKLFYFLILVLSFSGCTKKKTSGTPLPATQTFYLSLGSAPTSLHPIRSTQHVSSVVRGYVFESLLTRDINTREFKPLLANRWEISSDQISYTFYLQKNVSFHDGKPLTAHDVKFSIDAFKDVSYGGYSWISYLENVDRVEVVDSHTVRVYMKEKQFGSFDKVSTFLKILPKHIYENKKTGLNFTIVGSGPYRFEKLERKKRITLIRDKKWWGNEIYKDEHNFESITFRIIQSAEDRLLRMAQGQIDFLSLSPEDYYKKTSQAPWGETVLKKQIENSSPKSYNFIAWNFKNPLFQDVLVRKALTYLINRTLMNEKFNNNSHHLLAGPVYPSSEYSDPETKPLLFSPEKAQQLLKQAGWRDSDQDGVLDKVMDGQKLDFEFTLLFPAQVIEKYLTLYQQDLKKNGIKVNLKFVESITFFKLVTERNFDAASFAWVGGDVEWYPKQIWHSSSMQGSNYIGYKNKQVDQLIDQADVELDRKKRIQLLQKAYVLISEDYPYSFLFSPRYIFYAHSQRVKILQPTYRYSLGMELWSFDE